MWHFGRVLGFGGVLAVLIAFGPADVVAQKKKKEDVKKVNENAASPAEYKQIQNKKELFGTVTSMNGTSLVLRIDTPHFESNPKYKPPMVQNPNAAGYNALANQQYQQWKNYQDLMRLQQQAMQARNQRELTRIQNRIADEVVQIQRLQMQMVATVQKASQPPPKGNSNNDPFIVVKTSKEYELDIQKKAVIRKTFFALEYDDNTGKIKVFTEKEKAALRGDDKSKPGYLAKLDELVAGTEAKLYLTPPKVKPNDDAGVGNVEKPTIHMIVMTKETSASSMQGAGPAKKDKKK